MDLSREHVGGSGTARRIALLATARIGSTLLRIVAEQRSGSRPQGTNWVESVAAKRHDLGCDVAIAVSGSGFTEAAQAIALDLRVRLRTVTPREPQYVAEHLYYGGLGTVQALDDVVMNVRPVIPELSDWTNDGSVLLVYAGTDDPVPETELLHLTWRAWPEHGVATPTAASLRVAIRNPRPDGTAFEVLSSAGRLSPEAIYVHVAMTFVRREWLISDAYEYVSPDGSAYVIFDVQAPGDPRKVTTVGQTRGEPSMGKSSAMIVSHSPHQQRLDARSLADVAVPYDGDMRAFHALDPESARSLAFATEMARNRGSAQMFTVEANPSPPYQLRFEQVRRPPRL